MMLKQSAVALVVVLILATSPTSAQEKTSRKGFVTGFSLGGGLLSLESGREVGATLAGFIAGYGLHEYVLLLLEGTAAVGSDAEETNIENLLISTQLFLNSPFFVRAGLGGSIGEVESLPDAPSTSAGFATAFSTGYEFRMLRRFALSPTFRVDYSRIAGGNHVSYGGLLDFRWYF